MATSSMGMGEALLLPLLLLPQVVHYCMPVLAALQLSLFGCTHVASEFLLCSKNTSLLLLLSYTVCCA